MGKFDGVLLVSDYDDTLYGSACRVSQRDRAAILSFTAQGGTFTVATGRARPAFAPQMAREALPVNAPVILSNGSMIYDFANDAVLHQTFLRPEVRDDLIALSLAIPSVGFEAYHGETVYAFNPNAVTYSHLDRAGITATFCPIEEMPLPWTKVLLEQDTAPLLAAREFLWQRGRAHYELIFSNRYLLELTAHGSNKGGAVLWLAERLSIHRSHIYCVGDNQNDLPMLAVSAVPYAPTGCAREVVEWGAHLTPSCDDGCIAYIIDELDRRY